MQKEIDFQQHFPEMKPISGPPSLVNLSGGGVGMYGNRDYDPETETYVKTHCFYLLFVPLVPLAAYRVADAPDGWYFFGRVPLSALARMWNVFLVVAVLSGAGSLAWTSYTGTEQYRAGRELSAARDLLAGGHPGRSAEKLRQVGMTKTPHAFTARQELRRLAGDPLDGMPLAEAARVLENAIVLEGFVGKLDEKRQELFTRALGLVRERQDEDPAAALEVVRAAERLADDDDDALFEVKEGLLETALARDPRDVEVLSDLAVVLEKRGDLDRAETLLAPHAGRLGTREGARVLGQIYSRRQRFDEAFRLLTPYVGARLDSLHEAETRHQEALDAVWNGGVRSLQSGKASGFDYRAYQRADEDIQNTMVQEYLQGLVERNPRVRITREELMRESIVVPVALDLAMVRLQRAQKLGDPAARQEELQEAEKLFLAIRGQAEESDEYRLFYGQVCYWLGKHDEGRRLFDELLAKHQRSSDMLVAAAGVLRQLGLPLEARRLSEEAWEKAETKEKKYEAASLRALCPVDIDDEIEWLKRCSPSDVYTRGLLALSEGTRAMQNKRNDDAAIFFRKALERFLAMPKTMSTLNNASLAASYLHRLTGKREDFRRGLSLIEEAVQLQPSNSILLFNVAEVRFQGAILDTIDGAVDLGALQRGAGIDLLYYLYSDMESRRKYIRKLREQPDFARAMEAYEKNLLLSPKSVRTYATLHQILRFLHDLEGLRKLAERVRTVHPDVGEIVAQRREVYAGSKDAEFAARYAKIIDENEKEALRFSGDERPTELAIAASTLVSNLMEAWTVGHDVDADSLVEWAEKAHGARACVQTRSNLMHALCFRAARDLEKKNASFAEMARKTRRSLGAMHLLLTASTIDGRLRNAVLENPDMKRAARILRGMDREFPDWLDGWDWAFLRAFYPEDGDSLLQRLVKDELVRASRELSLALSPLDARASLEAWLALRAEGRDEDAREILRKAAEEGTPLPFRP